MARTNHMEYLPGQEQIKSDIMEQILSARDALKFEEFSEIDAQNAIKKAKNQSLNLKDLAVLLSPAASPFLEEMAAVSKALKERYFGHNIYLFNPIYISNHCDNNCVYCGFSLKNKIKRAQLDENALHIEMQNIAKTGLEEILILTGEAQSTTPLSYIGQACKIASQYFRVVGVEIYPLNTDEYAFLHSCGVDFVTVFQETYSSEKYAKIHLEGNKRVFPYRINAQERALKGGIRGVAFAALLGIDEWRKDAFCTAMHAYLIQKKYPHAEISLSVPRLRPIINNSRINPRDVGEKELAQVIMAYRLFLPYANITLSTRENAHFRDNAIKIGISKISAGVSVGIGEHGGKDKESTGDGQFEISDARSVEEIKSAILKANLTPVLSDHVFV